MRLVIVALLLVAGLATGIAMLANKPEPRNQAGGLGVPNADEAIAAMKTESAAAGRTDDEDCE